MRNPELLVKAIEGFIKAYLDSAGVKHNANAGFVRGAREMLYREINALHYDMQSAAISEARKRWRM